MDQLTLDSARAAAVPAPRTWGGYILERREMAGKVGPRWQQGGKCHLVICDFIVGYVDGYTPKPGQMKKGDCFSAHTPCNSNGQHIAHGVDGWSLDLISCVKCKKAL
jgi:hypothetical protein